jgi:hypothetical protein
VSLPLQDLLWELRQRSAIRVQVKEEIEPKEVAVNKRAGLVNAA